MTAEIAAVANSTIGNVHQTIFTTLSDSVNNQAIGKTSKHKRKNDMSNGKSAYLNACNIP